MTRLFDQGAEVNAVKGAECTRQWGHDGRHYEASPRLYETKISKDFKVGIASDSRHASETSIYCLGMLRGAASPT